MADMDDETAGILIRTTSDFYRRQAASFSATRRAPWPGWRRLLAGPAGGALREGRSVLDVGCGNLRFERFLEEAAPNPARRVVAVDDCAPLVGDVPAGTTYLEADVLAALLDGGLAQTLPAAVHGRRGGYDLVACFGFMHHVPGKGNRASLLRQLAARLAPGGCLAVSFWQFANSPALLARAREAHARGIRALAASGLEVAQLEEDDFLLGWQDVPDAFRYCHCFDEAEVAATVRAAGLENQVVDRFEADGRTGNLNAYVVIRG